MLSARCEALAAVSLTIQVVSLSKHPASCSRHYDPSKRRSLLIQRPNITKVFNLVVKYKVAQKSVNLQKL